MIMPFKNILVALDGSKYSQMAADYAFSLAANLGANVSGQHVVDPRLVDLFIEPEFAAELGFTESIRTSDKVFSGLRKIGKLVLDLFASEAVGRAMKVHTYLDEGYVLSEILKRSADYDLLVIGHRGKGEHRFPAEMIVGAMAERAAAGAKCPVLVATRPMESIKQILVAFDGSEPAVGSLLLAEKLAKALQLPLKAIVVYESKKDLAGAHLTIEQGQNFLKENSGEVFKAVQGNAAATILEQSAASNSLLVLGAYGFKNKSQTVLGSTATEVVRRSNTSTIIYR
jgi:nucleotide-binding universal stress UspA family protein